MNVETFECYETAAEPIEAVEEAVGIMESLGLDGQLSLVRPKDGNKPAARCPYREMTAEETFVYRTLCPSAVALSEYRAGPIPLRVLQVAAHAQSLGLFHKLFVWDKESAVVQDPVLVGETRDWQWTTGFQRMILARWGETLDAFATMRKQACEIHRDKLAREAESIRHQILSASDDELMKHANVGW